MWNPETNMDAAAFLSSKCNEPAGKRTDHLKTIYRLLKLGVITLTYTGLLTCCRPCDSSFPSFPRVLAWSGVGFSLFPCVTCPGCLSQYFFSFLLFFLFCFVLFSFFFSFSPFLITFSFRFHSFFRPFKLSCT